MRDQVQVREAVEVGQARGVGGIELDATLHAAGRDRLDRHPLVRRERRAHDSDRSERDLVHRARYPSRSMITVVALTTAAAESPGLRPRSSSESVLSSDTTRNGPHASSIWLMTRPRLIATTVPSRRLRALDVRARAGGSCSRRSTSRLEITRWLPKRSNWIS